MNYKNKFISRFCVSFVLSSFALSVNAELFKEKEAETIKDAFSEGTTQFNFRLRYEDVSSGTQGAQALTLRSRLSFETLPYELFTAYIEFDDVRAIPNDDNYYSGSNNQFDDLLIEDPKGTEVNQAWLGYDLANTFIKFGRQSIGLNNQRILGGDSWRQNEQTFLALSIQNEMLNYTRLEFAQLNQVQTNQDKTANSAHQDINAKLLNLNYRGFWLSDLSFYALWIRDHQEERLWETSTYGINLKGKLGGDFAIDYQLDFAQQEDAGANPSSYSVGYTFIDLIFSYKAVQLKTGYERLGASKTGYFVTPLGSLYEFQGGSGHFASNGLGNIETGIQDSYISLGYQIDISAFQKNLPISISASYHNFDVDTVVNNISHLGEEWVIKAGIELDTYQVLMQFAEYHADQYAQDTRHIWLSLGMSL